MNVTADGERVLASIECAHDKKRGVLVVTRTAVTWNGSGRRVLVPLGTVCAARAEHGGASLQLDVDDGETLSFTLPPEKREDGRQAARLLADAASRARSLGDELAGALAFEPRSRSRHRRRRRSRVNIRVEPEFSDDDADIEADDEDSDAGARARARSAVARAGAVAVEVAQGAADVAHAIAASDTGKWIAASDSLDIALCVVALLAVIVAVVTLFMADVLMLQVRLIGITVSAMAR